MPEQRIPDGWEHVKKVVVTGIGLIGVILLSIIETVVFTTLFLLSLILCPLSCGPSKRFAELTGSSLFTMIWGIVNFCINPILCNLATDERSARRLASGGCFIPGLYRPEDHLYFESLLTRLQVYEQSSNPPPNEPPLPPVTTDDAQPSNPPPNEPPLPPVTTDYEHLVSGLF